MIPLPTESIREALVRTISQPKPLSSSPTSGKIYHPMPRVSRREGLSLRPYKPRKRLSEVTIRQIKAGIGNRFKTKSRAAVLRSYYLGVDRKGDILFKTTSGTFAGHYWYQKIHFIDFRKAVELMTGDKPLTAKEAVNLALFGDIAVHCNDPSWKYYGWQYIATQLGYAIHPEDRYPVKRNPQCKGTVCKHLYNVLTVLPTHISLIARDMRKRGFFPVQVKAKKK